jgi:hypothetical protein
MNLDRISIKRGNDTTYMTLAKISDFSKLYTTILFDNNFSMQKINTGDSIQAFNFKNIEQFKGYRPFIALKQDQLLFLNDNYGADFLYQTKLHAGDLVRYNGLKYIVLGIIVNTYAQWNMPTPLLLNPTNINNDFKSLFGSRVTDEQIVKKINDNFQAGKYDADMIIPLVDANDFSEYITIVQPRPTKEEVQLMFDSVKAEKDLTIKAQKDVFIDTMLRLRGNEINEIKAVNEDLFKGVQTLLLSVNKAVNEQIELLPEPVKEKPARKPRAKKVVEKVEPVSSGDLPDFIEIGILIKDMPLQLMKLSILRMNQQDEKVTDYDTLSSIFNWEQTPEGQSFWEKINEEGDLREFKKLYGNKGEKVDELLAKSELPKQPEVDTQEVKRVDIILYPPEGGVLQIKTDSFYELFDISRYILSKYKSTKRKFIFEAINDNGTYTTEIYFSGEDTQDELFNSLVEKFDTFVEPELHWQNFYERQADIDKIKLNEEIIDDAFKPEPKPVEVEKPKVNEVELVYKTPSGKVLKFKTSYITEFFALTSQIFSRLEYHKFSFDKIELSINAITDSKTYSQKVTIENTNGIFEVLSRVINKFNAFEPTLLDWSKFEYLEAVITSQYYNLEKIADEIVGTKKPVAVEKPKPVAKPKPVEVEKPKPVVEKYTARAFEGKTIKHTLSDSTFSDEIELFVRENEKKGYEVIVDFYNKGKLERQVYKTKKPVAVEKPKPVKVEKPKPVAKPKPVKVTKPKVEDDLSFLDDLDNIF